MNPNEPKTFEEALERLEKAAEALKREDLPLEEAMKNYEDGIRYFNQCEKILKAARQKIETFQK